MVKPPDTLKNLIYTASCGFAALQVKSYKFPEQSPVKRIHKPVTYGVEDTTCDLQQYTQQLF